MIKRKLQAVINRLEDDIKNTKSGVLQIIKEDLKMLQTMPKHLQTQKDFTKIAQLECEESEFEGFINGIEFAIDKLEMLKESIKD